MMPGLFDDILNQDGGGQILIDKSGRFDKLNPSFQNQIMGLANDFYAQFKTPLIITDTYRTQSEQALAHMRKPTLAVSAGPNARHPMGLAIDIDQNQAKMIDPQLLANYGLGLPAINKGETWHIEPVVRQASNPQSGQAGLFDDILSQPKSKPQPGKVASIPEIVGPALQQAPPPAPADPMSESLNMFSPQAAMQGFKDIGGILNKDMLLGQLPVAGMIAGGTVGGIGTGGPGAIPGAALGGAGGKALELYLRGQKGESLPSIPSQAMQIGTSGLAGATAEMGGQIAGKALEGIFAPGKKWLDTQIDSVAKHRVAQEMASQGVPISPETIAPSRAAKAVTWIAERFQPGKSIVDSYRKQAMDMIYKMRQNLVEDLGLPSMGAKPLGTAREEIGQTFGKFREAIGPDAQVPMTNTKTFLDNLELSGKAANKDIDLIASLRGRMPEGVMTVSEIEKMNSILWPKGRAYSKMSPAEKTWRDDFLQNVFRDLEPLEVSNGMNLAELLKQAKGTTRDIYQAQYIERLLGRATNDETLMFNPQAFYNIVKQNEAQIYRNLDTDKAKNLFSFADKMKAIAPERAKFLEGRSRTDILSYLPGAGLAAGTYMNPYMAIPIGFQGIVARSLMAPKGIIRTWLTKGYSPPTLPIKVGIMEESKND